MDSLITGSTLDQLPNLVPAWHESPGNLTTAADNHSLMSGAAAPLSPQYLYSGMSRQYHSATGNVMPTNLVIDTQLSTSSSTTRFHFEDDLLNNTDASGASDHEEVGSPLSARHSISISSFDELLSPMDTMDESGHDMAEGNAQYRLECIRERNRVAARKYRQKQKDRSSKLERDGERLHREREKLITKVRRLQNENNALKQRCQDGLCWNCRQPI